MSPVLRRGVGTAACALAVGVTGRLAAQARLPVRPTALIEGRFTSAEGIAFTGEGRLFITADKALWEVTLDGQVGWRARLASNLGLAPIGDRDVLIAEFGPLVAPRDGPNVDGEVLRFTPGGSPVRLAGGMGDPNAILVRGDGSLLVSDDFTSNVYLVSADGAVELFTDLVRHPNGLAIAPDGTALYVAQIFTQMRPRQFDQRVWRIPLADGAPTGEAEVLFRTAGTGGCDGLVVDEHGRIYVAAVNEGRIWRYDPATRRQEMIAEHLPGIASLAFGRAPFDEQSLYAIQIRGGRLLRFKLGVRGAPLIR